MNAENHEDIAGQIQAAILATPGVRTVYRSGSLVSNLAEVGATAIGLRAADHPVVAVRAGESGVDVDASIGIDYSAPAREVLRAVRAAIGAAALAAGVKATVIALTVAYVHPRETS